jgi:hypothetical protein
MTRLRITPNGAVVGLWTDDVEWTMLGRLSVHRASHVEFCQRLQQWYVQVAQPRGWMRRIIQRLTGRPRGEILYWADTRQMALAWEQEHFARN